MFFIYVGPILLELYMIIPNDFAPFCYKKEDSWTCVQIGECYIIGCRLKYKNDLEKVGLVEVRAFVKLYWL